jgi:hypothetical protein
MSAEARTHDSRPAISEVSVQRYVVLFLWLFIGVFYASLITQWIHLNRQDDRFAQSMERIIQLGGTDNRPTKEVRALLLVRADELSIPIRGDEIHIRGGGLTLRATLHYEAEIKMPVINQSIYRMQFEHDVAFKQPN